MECNDVLSTYYEWLDSVDQADAFLAWFDKPEQRWRWHIIVRRIIDEILPPFVLQPVLGPAIEFDGPMPPTTIISSTKGQVLAMAEMTNTQYKNVHFRVLNRRGGPAILDGVPTWLTDNSDVLLLEPFADGMGCKVIAAGPLTNVPVNVTMQADADLGAGVKPILGTIAFTITPGEATVIELIDDPAQEQENVSPPLP